MGFVEGVSLGHSLLPFSKRRLSTYMKNLLARPSAATMSGLGQKGTFVAVMVVVWFLAHAIVDNFGISGAVAWIFGWIAIGFRIEHRRAIPER
jgi:hypothetical protein